MESEGSKVVTEEKKVYKINLKREKKQVQWEENVVDNENAGKKKSKICCIYHKQRQQESSELENKNEECKHNAYEQ